MKKQFHLFVLFIAAALASTAFGQKESSRSAILPPAVYKPIAVVHSASLQAILDDAVSKIMSAKGIKDGELAATVIDLSDPAKAFDASYQGGIKLYPASVVKLFYLAALERQIEDGKIVPSNELRRAERDMIVDSSNEATQLIVDVLTGTTGGPELPAKELERWQFKRNRVNRFFTALGYTGINVNQKTFCTDAYGIEQQSRGPNGENRNMLTTDATARLFAEIVTGRIAGKQFSDRMMEVLHREPFVKGDEADQAHAFIGKALIDRDLRDVKLWSKAGWTSTARHDAAYLAFPDGRKFIIVILTQAHANEKDIIPELAGRLIDSLKNPIAARGARTAPLLHFGELDG
ncbi:MAG: serine hydrolase [Chloracidobacterium sp.]|nr:serine hydrolase [Chloracidobacterium sp.]MCO5334262.1 class A beta-lactamase-related serine hydrolase [Pyrinomonadaceae bacterium]